MSTRRKKTSSEDSAESVQPLYTKGLNRKERQFALTTAFQELPATLEYAAKIRHLAKRQKTSPNTVLQQGERYGWRELHEKQVGEVEAVEATDRQAGTLTVLQPVAPLAPAAFLTELRSFTRAALAVSNNFTLVTHKLVSLVIQQIDHHVANTTEWDSYAWLTLDTMHHRLRRYLEPAKGFIQPGAIASLLTALDFKNSLPPEDADGKRFATVADLQKQLLELGIGATSNSEALATSFAQYGDLPDIAAHRSDIT